MKSLKTSAFAFMAVMIISGTAHAAVKNSTSYKYFDENGSFVGESVIFCSNQSSHGGNIHTAYQIEESKECAGNTPVNVIVPGTQVVAYTLPGFLSIGNACVTAKCVPSGVYPNRATGVTWTWYPGVE